MIMLTVTNEYDTYDRFYNGKVHTIVDLGMRDETADKGSVCGMAAVYQAGLQTLLTVSQIKQMSYTEVKIRIGETINLDSSSSKNSKDVTLLDNFYTGYNFGLLYNVYIPSA